MTVPTDAPPASPRSPGASRAGPPSSLGALDTDPVGPDEARAGAPSQAEAVVDLDAVAANVARLDEVSGAAEVMAVVKADGYGHGMVPCARAALAGGATWLGVTTVDEAAVLRSAGVTAPVLAWLHAPGAALAGAVASRVDLTASDAWQLDEVATAARETGEQARLHLKVDTGLNRNGARPEAWPGLCRRARALEASGEVSVVGVWSHLVMADAPDHPTVRGQAHVFAQAVDVARAAGLRPRWRHLANSAGTLTTPDVHLDLVRPGIAVYGVSPGPDVGTPAELGLRPAMTLRGRVALVKRAPAGVGVSYWHRYTTPRETTLALVPLGYGDGVPRAGTNRLEMLVGGRRRTVAGTVCMDQVVLDVEDDDVRAGDEVLLFGPGNRGEATAEDWAQAVDTIGYEIVTRIGTRVPRRHVGTAGT